ncbi:peptidoglycan-associated lipoprotein Pal [Rhizobacter sp. Root404]|jgi:peptidoglycan-associated lipoprotein|uniref:peptidoglycan-associated lipoprotein Pal n=1 Tax=Rhizobacter sp. Root404 TaxID=1736528 RepID=UPI0006F6E8E6|nr:peptidoglycan-associated lipoprotein Pal [Rhizobacter sp. Root404]KQW37777.1 peptidoglycan-binding protein [Rhizobacter sp. Root404]
MNKLSIPSLTALALAAMLAGCSSVPLGDAGGAPVESRTPGAGSGTAGAGAGGAAGGESRVTPVDLSKGTGNGDALSQRTVYFDFDSYVVKDEYRPLIDRFAKSLAADRKKRLQVEGHTDDRGGREYNLALGQKRAEAVAKSLALLGASDSQVEAVSFGKERPAVQGSDEAAWAKNRRAELNYR